MYEAASRAVELVSNEESRVLVSSANDLDALIKTGLLPRLHSMGQLLYDSIFEQQVAGAIDAAKLNAQRKAKCLARFAEQAEAAKLRYVVIKGMPLSRMIYGNDYARASSDIDILVSQDDLPKAHYVAEQAGFYQPMESFRARQLIASEMLDTDMLKAISSPFPVRNAANAPHLAQYYSIEENSHPVILEIHDSLHCLDARQAEEMLWNAEPCDIGGQSTLCLPIVMSVLVLLLSTHEDAEGILANCSPGPLGLANLFDLHCLMARMVSANVLAKLISSFGVVRPVGEVLYDLIELFPSDRARFGSQITCYYSPWGSSYPDRLVNAEARLEAAHSTIHKAISRIADRHWGLTRRIKVLGMKMDIAATVVSENKRHNLGLAVPKILVDNPHGLLFHIVLICTEGETRVCQLSVFKDEDGWKIAQSPVKLLGFGIHPRRNLRNIKTIDKIIERGERVVFETEIPGDTNYGYGSILVSVCKCSAAGIYKRVFGDDYDAELAEAIFKPHLFGRLSERSQYHE